MRLIEKLKEYASDNGYSHADYADVMRQAADEILRLGKTAERYTARRRAVFLNRQRMQVGGPSQAEAEFNAEYDDGCDKNINGYITDHRGGWIKDDAMTLVPNTELNGGCLQPSDF